MAKRMIEKTIFLIANKVKKMKVILTINTIFFIVNSKKKTKIILKKKMMTAMANRMIKQTIFLIEKTAKIPFSSSSPTSHALNSG